MRYFIPIILFFTCLLAEAQQFSLPSQVQRNYLYVNPSFAGIYNVTVANLMSRTKWIGMDGALAYQNFELQAPLKKQSVALGLQARHEKIGASNSSEFFIDYCHRIKIGNARLSFGIKAGIVSKSLGNVELQDKINYDAAFDKTNSIILPNFGVGVSVYHKKYYAGVSIPYLLGSVSGTDGNSSISRDAESYCFIATAGGKIKVNDNITIEPNGTYVYSLTLKPQYTFIANVNLKNKFVTGIGFRSAEAIILDAGFYFNRQISMIYSYDFNIGLIGPYSNGTHEIGLLYYFGYQVNAVNPRDF